MPTYKDVNFANGNDMDVSKFRNLSDNDRFLYENMTVHKYQLALVTKTDGIKQYHTITQMPGTTNWYTAKEVYFGDFFTPGCRPIITATAATANNGAISIITQGLDTSHLINHQGVRIFAFSWNPNRKDNHFPTIFHVHILATGY